MEKIGRREAIVYGATIVASAFLINGAFSFLLLLKEWRETSV